MQKIRLGLAMTGVLPAVLYLIFVMNENDPGLANNPGTYLGPAVSFLNVPSAISS